MTCARAQPLRRTPSHGPKAREVPTSALRVSICFILFLLPNLPLSHKGKLRVRDVNVPEVTKLARAGIATQLQVHHQVGRLTPYCLFSSSVKEL